MTHIDGDFKTDKQCKYHCSPSCHPAQVGPEWVYGCLHPMWPMNKTRDFCPIVDCNGEHKNCKIPLKRLNIAIGGKRRTIGNLHNKLSKAEAEMEELLQIRKAVIK